MTKLYPIHIANHNLLHHIAKQVKKGGGLPPLIFSGALGVGKKTYAKLFILECLGSFDLKGFLLPTELDQESPRVKKVWEETSPDIFSLDGLKVTASDIRDEVRGFLNTAPVEWPFKFLLVDNTETMAFQTQEMLLKVLEEGRTDVIPIFMTLNEDKLPNAMVGRSLGVKFLTPLKPLMIEVAKSDERTAPITPILEKESIHTITQAQVWSVCNMEERLERLLNTGDPIEVKEQVELLMKAVNGQTLTTPTQALLLFLGAAIKVPLDQPFGDAYKKTLADYLLLTVHLYDQIDHWTLNQNNQLRMFFLSLYAIDRFHRKEKT